MMILAARSTQVVLSQGNIRGCLSTSPCQCQHYTHRITLSVGRTIGKVFFFGRIFLSCIVEDLDDDVGGYQITS